MTAAARELTCHDAVAPDDVDTPIAALFDAQCAFVWRTLRHLGVDESGLDDAVQDVFVIAHRRWSSFEGRSSARTWLFGIARRVAYRHRRASNARRARLVSVSDAGPEPAHEPFDRLQAMQSLARLLGMLDRDKRAVFVLTELEGMTAPEVSDALGIPLGTVYSRSRAAWQSLGREAGRDEQRVRRQLAVARGAAPTSAHQRRMWALVAARLPGLQGATTVGVAKVAATTAWTAQLKAWVIGGAIGAGLVGARVLTVSSEPEPPRPSLPAIALSDVSAPPAASPEPEPATRPSPAGRDLADAPEPPRGTDESEAEASPIDRAATPRRARSGSRSRGRPPAPSPAPASSPADALTEELLLVRAAQRALGQDRPADALAELEAHASRFPKGQLSDDRRALRVTTLCALGRSSEAEREAAALGRDAASACEE